MRLWNATYSLATEADTLLRVEDGALVIVSLCLGPLS
jgi:hypothetical protein